MANNTDCDKNCFMKGKACVVSNDGKCAILFKNGALDKNYLRNFRFVFEQELKKYEDKNGRSK